MRRRVAGLLGIILLFVAGIGIGSILTSGVSDNLRPEAPGPRVALTAAGVAPLPAVRSPPTLPARAASPAVGDKQETAALRAAIARQEARVADARERYEIAADDNRQAEAELEEYRVLDERRWISRYDLADVERATAETRERAVEARIALDAEEARLAALRDGAVANSGVSSPEQRRAGD